MGVKSYFIFISVFVIDNILHKYVNIIYTVSVVGRMYYTLQLHSNAFIYYIYVITLICIYYKI